jgi:flagellar basal body rod protein FlgG
VENTFLVCLSQQMAATRAMWIANNLANLGTRAFKRETVQFKQYVVQLPANKAGPGPSVNIASVLSRPPMATSVQEASRLDRSLGWRIDKIGIVPQA